MILLKLSTAYYAIWCKNIVFQKQGYSINKFSSIKQPQHTHYLQQQFCFISNLSKKFPNLNPVNDSSISHFFLNKVKQIKIFKNVSPSIWHLPSQHNRRSSYLERQLEMVFRYSKFFLTKSSGSPPSSRRWRRPSPPRPRRPCAASRTGSGRRWTGSQRPKIKINI